MYLAPSIARSPDQVSGPRPNDEPTTSPSSLATTAPPTSVPGSRAGGPDRAATKDAADPTGDTPNRGTGSTSRKPDRTNRGATPYDPNTRGDSEPPQPVAKIAAAKVTAHDLSLDWAAARDNVRVIGYHVWLNGFDVASTAETHATIRWFNDDTEQHVVQVKAVDAAGNTSVSSPTLLVTRPAPEPEPSPSPTDSPSTAPEPDPEPTGSAAPSAEPTDSAAAAPTAEASGTPSGSG